MINTKGEILSSDLWFKSVTMFFYENYACVQRKDGKWNFLNDKGQFLSSDIWFDKYDCDDILPIGILNKKRYYFNKDDNKFHHNLFG